MAQTGGSTPTILPQPQASSSDRGQNTSPEGQSNRAVPCPPHGADHACGVSLLVITGCRSGSPSLLLRLQWQGKHGGEEREETKKLCSCLPTNAGLGRNWFWFHVITQNNINVSRYLSRLTFVYLSSAIMICTKLLKILQGPALWSRYISFFKPLSGLEDRFYHEPEWPEVRKSIFHRILELRIKVYQHYSSGYENQTFPMKIKNGLLLSLWLTLGFWTQH